MGIMPIVNALCIFLVSFQSRLVVIVSYRFINNALSSHVGSKRENSLRFPSLFAFIPLVELGNPSHNREATIEGR